MDDHDEALKVQTNWQRLQRLEGTFCFLISHLVSSERDIFLVRSTNIVFIIKVSPFAVF